MADAWLTFPFQFKGGLVTNLSPLQQGVQLPGSARILRNFEPAVSGGYKRIEGYTKYSTSFVPAYGAPLVQGSGQTGTSLTISNLFITPVAGDTFTIAGVAGTYTIQSVSSYSSSSKTATLALTASLASSPADKAAITFTTHSGLINGLAVLESSIVACRNNNIYSSTGTTWSLINTPSFGTVLVNGAGQTGTSLAIDGLSAIPRVGDTFKINGVQKVYTVTADATVVSTGTTLTITPALASSPADNAAITWLSLNVTSTEKARFAKYRINNTNKLAIVDSTNYPLIWDGSTTTRLDSTTDLLGSQLTVFHKNHLFFVKDDKLIFTAPFTDSDFNAANGAGVISIGALITGTIVFRDILIIFTERSISQLVGNTLSDFQLQPITRNVGCVAKDTIQEISGDVIFLGSDGLRLLSATDRNGDFNLGLVSKTIQTEMTDLLKSNESFSSVVIKRKSQYRIFGYSPSVTSSNAKGILGTQVSGETTSEIHWAELSGIKSYVADSLYKNQSEIIVFANTTGFVYQMENGNTFDGVYIPSSFATPYVFINDPRVRKTFYKLFLYTDPKGSVSVDVNLKFDFDNYGSIQPTTIILSNVNGESTGGFYGDATTRYGITVYGTKLKKLYQTQVIGSGFFVSLQFFSQELNPPFSLDAATLEYSTHDRR
jgi:hypothetical protein